MKICPNCGCGFSDTTKFCTQCGTPLPAGVFAVRVTEGGIEEIQAPVAEVIPPAAVSRETPVITEPETSVPAAPETPAPAAPVSDTPAAPVSDTPAVPLPTPPKVRRRRSPFRWVIGAAVVLILAISMIWGFSLLRNLFSQPGRTQKDCVTVLASDNEELVGYSASGKMVRLKTEEGIREEQQSPDGSRCLFLTTENQLMLFDGSRFTSVAEDVKQFAFSFDGSAAAYLTQEDELFLYRGGKSQRVAANVTADFCISPDGKAVAYVRDDGEERKAYYYDGREREIAKDAVPAAVSSGGRYLYYYSSKGILYVQKGSNTDSRQKLVDRVESLCFNTTGEQILVSDGASTYFSEKGGERNKVSSQALVLLPPQGMAADAGGFRGIDSLKDRYYLAPGTGGLTVYQLNGRLELNSLMKNVQTPALLSDGRTMVYSKNGNLYWMDLKKPEDRETKLADNHRGFRVSLSGKNLLFIDEEGETWFATAGGSSRRITADTIDLSRAAAGLNGSFVYELEGSLYYTNGGKPSKISGLTDDVQTLSGNGFWVMAECKNGDVFVSKNGRDFTRYIRK